MARRRNTRPFEDLADLVSLLPWWAGVALALVFYVVLHRVAAQQVIAAAAPGQIGSMVTQTVWRSFATVGQYILPLICLAGAGLSAWRCRERQALVGNVAESKAADALDGMSWQQFEKLVGEAFRLQGYAVTEVGGGGADGGVDLVLRKGSEKFFVQCKQWRAFKVGVDVVRELYGVMAAKGATGGFVVTSGGFTDEATRFANGRNVTLIDGPALHGLIRQALRTRPQQPVAGATAAPMQEQAATAASAVPKCPDCTKPMVKRTAKRGTNAGGAFWGCTGYPACRGVRPYASTE
jgi:restriction system protein